MVMFSVQVDYYVSIAVYDNLKLTLFILLKL